MLLLLVFGRVLMKLLPLCMIIICLFVARQRHGGEVCAAESDGSDSMRVVVSMTTTPYRLQHLKGSLDWLLHKQTRPPDLVQINIPRIFARTNKSYPSDEELPAWMKNNDKVRVHRIERDYGPLTKLLPVLATERDPRTVIVILDDDTVYFKYTIEFIADIAFQSEGNFSAIGHCGDHMFLQPQTFAHTHLYESPQSEDARGERARLAQRHSLLPALARSQRCCCSMLEAYASAAFSRSVFDRQPFIPSLQRRLSFEEYVEMALESRSCFVSDDWVTSNFLALCDVPGLDLTNIIKFMQLPHGHAKGPEGGVSTMITDDAPHPYKLCMRHLESKGLSRLRHIHADNPDPK